MAAVVLADGITAGQLQLVLVVAVVLVELLPTVQMEVKVLQTPVAHVHHREI
jgi:hypothetical protein